MAYTDSGQDDGIATLDEQRTAHLAALERELEGYKRRDDAKRVKAVEKEIAKLADLVVPAGDDGEPADEAVEAEVADEAVVPRGTK